MYRDKQQIFSAPFTFLYPPFIALSLKRGLVRQLAIDFKFYRMRFSLAPMVSASTNNQNGWHLMTPRMRKYRDRPQTPANRALREADTAASMAQDITKAGDARAVVAMRACTLPAQATDISATFIAASDTRPLLHRRHAIRLWRIFVQQIFQRQNGKQSSRGRRVARGSLTAVVIRESRCTAIT